MRRNPSTASSANRREAAWLSLRAAALPDESIDRNRARSSSVRVTLYVRFPATADLLRLLQDLGVQPKDGHPRHTRQSNFDRPLVTALEETWPHAVKLAAIEVRGGRHTALELAGMVSKETLLAEAFRLVKEGDDS